MTIEVGHVLKTNNIAKIEILMRIAINFTCIWHRQDINQQKLSLSFSLSLFLSLIQELFFF